MMRTPRLFCPELSSSKYQCTNLKQIHHLAKVLRLGAGDSLELFNGHGLSATGVIVDIARKTISIEVDNLLTLHNPYRFKYQAIIPYIKKDNLIYLVQKLIEIGINSIIFYRPDHMDQSLLKRDLTKLKLRLEETIIHACEQSGCNFLPIVHDFNDLCGAINGVLKNINPKDLYVFDTLANKLFGELEATPSNILAFITGPESGFSEKERIILDKQNLIKLRINNYILRAETAPIVALSKLHSLQGEVS